MLDPWGTRRLFAGGYEDEMLSQKKAGASHFSFPLSSSLEAVVDVVPTKSHLIYSTTNR